MTKKNEVVTTGVNELAEGAMLTEGNLTEIFGEKVSQPAIVMFDGGTISPIDLINVSIGENVSLDEIINMEVTLEGYGGVRLEYVDEETGELLPYNRYILATSEGVFTTTSAFIGRALAVLMKTMSVKPIVRFTRTTTNVGGETRSKYMMKVVGVADTKEA